MNCAIHPEVVAAAFCRNCGNAICEECKSDWQGAAHCPECAEKLSAAAEEHKTYAPPPPRSAPPEPPSPAGAPSPVLATMLGLIPGVGAVYNGQYAKGVFHVVIFGGLISLVNSEASAGFEPLFGLLIALFYFYMPLEAYRTASALQSGEPVDEFSGWISSSRHSQRSPIAGIVLIVLGLVFLMHTMGFWSLRELSRYWPVILILLGAHMLYKRFSEVQEIGKPGSGVRLGDSPVSPRQGAGYEPSEPGRSVTAEPSDKPQTESTAVAGFEKQPES